MPRAYRPSSTSAQVFGSCSASQVNLVPEKYGSSRSPVSSATRSSCPASRSREQMQRLRDLGANEVVQPEFEAGLELIRHVMHVHGLDQRQVGAIVQRRREMYYTVDERQ